jgi:hypothetical protein
MFLILDLVDLGTRYFTPIPAGDTPIIFGPEASTQAGEPERLEGHGNRLRP